jgi:hypothetical protein
MSLPILLIYLLYVSRLRWPTTPLIETRFMTHSLAGVAVLCIAASHSLYNLSFLPANQLNEFQKVITGKYSQPDNIRTPLIADFKLEESLLSEIEPDATIDIFPYDIALLYAYNLNWSPRPQFQSYAAYVPALDALNAGHFQGPDTPAQVLWRSKSIDTRYFPFDEPQVFRVLLDRYQFSTKESTNRFALLRLDPQRKERTWIAVGGIEQHHFFGPIIIPNIENCHIYMSVQISPNILGRLLNFFYKAPYPTMVIRTRNGGTYSHRFIRAQGPDGFYVSKYIADAEDLRLVIQEEYTSDIESIEFIGSKWFYSQTIFVQFYSIPFRKD